MSGGDAGEKTNAPTPKRLEEARKEGNVPKSADIGAWVSMGAALMVLPMTVGAMREAFTKQFATVLAIISDPDPGKALASLGEGLTSSLILSAPICMVTLVVALVAGVAQGGMHLATKAAKPQASRLNPLKGIKRLFSPHTLWEALKLLLKSAVVGVVLYRTMSDAAPRLIGAGAIPLGAVISSTIADVNGLIRSAVLAGLVIAAADYMVNRRRIMKQLRMSHKEIQDEHKQTEGDPHVKGAIKSRQMAMSRNRMMSDLATADVVMVNPTHVAVALRYDAAKGAPRVVAKGAGAVAAKIRETAAEHRVPMVANVPLARALYGACEIGQEIPMELYAAVAQVLAFVMRLRSRGASAGTHKLQVPDIPSDVRTRGRRRRPMVAAGEVKRT